MAEVAGTPAPFVMTTWHDDEPLDETIDFFATHTRVDDAPPEDFVVVVLGGTEANEGLVREAVLRRFC